MEIKQAIEILDQAIGMSLSGGIFKNRKDVVVVNAAMEAVIKYVGDTSTKKVSEPEQVSEPVVIAEKPVPKKVK